MKVFAILTACMMAAGGVAYYLDSPDSHPSCCRGPKDASLTTPEAGCPGDAAKPSCCALSAQSAKPVCCSTGGPNCCGPTAPCCEAGLACCATGACCDGAKAAAQVAAQAAATEDCCAGCVSPAKLGAAAATAGVALK